jgi:hypothetical protein
VWVTMTVAVAVKQWQPRVAEPATGGCCRRRPPSPSLLPPPPRRPSPTPPPATPNRSDGKRAGHPPISRGCGRRPGGRYLLRSRYRHRRKADRPRAPERARGCIEESTADLGGTKSVAGPRGCVIVAATASPLLVWHTTITTSASGSRLLQNRHNFLLPLLMSLAIWTSRLV